MLVKSCGDCLTALAPPPHDHGAGGGGRLALPTTRNQPRPQRSPPRGAGGHSSQFTLKSSQSSKILLDSLAHNSAISNCLGGLRCSVLGTF